MRDIQDFDKKKKYFIVFKRLLAIVVFILLILGIIAFVKSKSVDFLQEVKENGFTDLDEHFICSAIKKDSYLMMSTRKYSFISINGEVYNISFTSTYGEKENCEKRNFPVKIKSHIDDIVVGEDNKYYSVYENLLLKEDVTFSYDIKDIVQKVDNYILKKDGNIYYLKGGKLILKYKGSSFKGKIQNISLINSDYSEEDEKKIIILTDKAVYYSYSDNEKNCRKYANEKCNYVMRQDKLFSKYRNKLLYIDDTIVITIDGKVLYTNHYFGA